MSAGRTISSGRLNVLVYSGTDHGSTVESVRHCLYTLRRLLAPNYAVIPITADMLIKEPWLSTCAMLVMPGGADLGYCASLNGAGNRRITQFVQNGGAYLGFCAGGYYGSRRCEFEVGDKKMQVIGERELAFFPGICRGSAFEGFVYSSEAGARAVEVKVSKSALSSDGTLPETFHSYYNGGGVFVDAETYADEGVEILASYTEELAVDSGKGAAAVIYRKIGDGAAVLTGPHPEFAAVNLNKSAGSPEYAELIDQLATDDTARTDFVKACLTKLGLQVSQETTTVPSLSCLHLSSVEPEYTQAIVSSLEEIMTKDGRKEILKDNVDTFQVERAHDKTYKMDDLKNALEEEVAEEKATSNDGIIDYNAIVKRLLIHDELPSSKQTPYFNHHAFYSNLRHYQSLSKEAVVDFGRSIIYGEVVTSTSSMLEKNTRLLRRLPAGFTMTATVQVAGRGRGSNVWVSPAGALIFSTVVRHPMEKMQSAPIVFIQYLAAMAVVKGIKTYDKGYEQLPIKMKWPNDVYAMDPAEPDKQKYTKICGILVNSHYSSEEYVSVVGIGINATNAAPTTSLNAIVEKFASPATIKSSPIILEKLLARILTVFEELYIRFLRTGFDKQFEDMYYEDWLHMHQIVTLEEQGGVRARIKGIGLGGPADGARMAVAE
uniref:Biotin--protein ligase n=1 Tax=Talaromyces marneffei PM1 TaxID=1077442 RepID=A0A093VZ52_TALMA